MAIESFSQIGANKPLVPEKELKRTNYIKANRKLFDGEFNELNLQYLDKDDNIPGLNVNWFRRAATFFPEFMLADRPTIQVPENPRLEALLEEISVDMWERVAEGNVDMLSLGEGILVSHPYDPTSLLRVPPDQYFEVRNNSNEYIGDIFWFSQGELWEETTKIDVYKYEVPRGRYTKATYSWRAGTLGAILSAEQLPVRANQRQSVFLYREPNHISIFDDMKTSIGEMCRELTSLGTTIRKNLRPHLYGPDGAVTVGEDGKAAINPAGMYFPLQEGDTAPGYLQWDPKLDAVQYSIGFHLEHALTSAGLSRIIFDPENLRLGQLSGTALKRLLLPFVARLNRLVQVNTNVAYDLIELINANLGATGNEQFEFRRSGITVTFTFEDIFSEATSEGEDTPTAT